VRGFQREWLLRTVLIAHEQKIGFEERHLLISGTTRISDAAAIVASAYKARGTVYIRH
jgi:hypothetical protein